MAIVPALSGLIGERQLRDTLREVGIVEIAVIKMGIRIEFSHRGFAIEPVSDTRGVPQQVLDRNRAFERIELERGLASFVGQIDADFRIGKSRNIFRDWIVEGQPALVDQHHRGNRRNDLRHRIDLENGIRRHRLPGRWIPHAETFEIDRLAVLLDQQDRAGYLAGRDFVANVVANTIKGRA